VTDLAANIPRAAPRNSFYISKWRIAHDLMKVFCAKKMLEYHRLQE
jgi:hypothetical protein